MADLKKVRMIFSVVVTVPASISTDDVLVLAHEHAVDTGIGGSEGKVEVSVEDVPETNNG